MDNEYEEEFNDLLDEVYPYWEFGGVKYYPSQIIKAVDPIHYDIALNEYTDSREREEDE